MKSPFSEIIKELEANRDRLVALATEEKEYKFSSLYFGAATAYNAASRIVKLHAAKHSNKKKK